MKLTKRVALYAVAACLLCAPLFGCQESNPASDASSGGTTGAAGPGFDVTLDGNEAAGGSTGPAGTDASGNTTAATGGKNTGTTTTKKGQTTTTRATAKPGEVIPMPPSSDYPGRVTDLKGRKIKVIIWDSDQPGGSGSQISNAYKKLNEKIQTELNCTLEFLWEPGADFITSVAAGNPRADIWGIGDMPTFLSAYTAGLLQPLDDLGVIDFEDYTRYTRVSEMSVYNNKHYGVGPRTFGHFNMAWAQVMVVNFEALQKANAKYTPEYLYGLQNKNQFTWSVFEEIANALITAGVQPVEDFGTTTGKASFYQTLVNANGADWISRSGNSAKFTGGEGAALAALNQYETWSKAGIIKQAADGATALNNFTAGKTAFLAAYESDAVNTATIKAMKNYGVIYPPNGPNLKERKAFTGMASFATIPKNVKNPAEVATVLMQLCSPLLSAQEDRVMALQAITNASKLPQSVNTLMEIYDSTVKNKGPNTLWYGIASGAKIDTTKNNEGWYDLIRKIGNQNLTSAGAVTSAKKTYDTRLEQVFKVR